MKQIFRTPSPQKLLQQVYAMKPDVQVQVYNALRDNLLSRGLIQP